MWYPEEANTYCSSCDVEIPADAFWRGKGYSISRGGRQERITVLFSQCPGCGKRFTTGLDGPMWHRLLYGWLWKLRYPRRRAPRFAAMPPVETRRRAANE